MIKIVYLQLCDCMCVCIVVWASNKITTLIFHRKAHPSKVKMAHSVNSVTSRDKLGRVGGYDSLAFKMRTKFSCERL